MSDPRRPRRLPILDRITVKTPCPTSWDEMDGDDRVRLCLSCAKNVFDLSAMHADEAEAFLETQLGANSRACVRLHRRPDGRILTSECAPGARRRHIHRIVGSVVGGVAAAVMAGVALQPTLGPDVPNDDARMQALDTDLTSRMLLAPLSGHPLEASAVIGEIDDAPRRFLDERELCRAFSDPEEDSEGSVDHACAALMRAEREAPPATMTVRLVASRRF